MKQMTKWMGCLFGAGLVCALPWTPLWKPILEVGYSPVLCVLNVDHWFSASGTLVLSDGTGADLSEPDDPARRAEVDRAIWLCHTYRCSTDFMLWTDDPGSGPTVRIRAKAWSPDKARGLVGNVIDKYNAGEGPSSTPSAANGDWSFEGDAFGGGGEATPPEPEPEDYRAECLERMQRFADLIATADSLLVKDFRLGVSPLDGDYETSDPAEIAEFNDLFRFVPIDGPGGMHLCAGHPEVTWRRGGEVVARITVGHGESIRWDGFGYWLGDVPLARESTLRLAEWFQSRGFHIAEEWHLGASRATEKAGGLGPASIEVQIRGDVIRPGNYTVEEGFSLGGLLDMAEPIHREDPWLRPLLRRVTLWRDVDGQRTKMYLNCDPGKPGRDFLLQDGDEVLVTHPF